MPSRVLGPDDDDRAVAVDGDRGPPDVEPRAGDVDRLAGLAVGEVEQADLVAASLGDEVGEALGRSVNASSTSGPRGLWTT